MNRLLEWIRNILRAEPLKAPAQDKFFWIAPDEATAYALFGDKWREHATVKDTEEPDGPENDG